MTRTIATLATVLLLALAGCGGANESKPNAGTNTTGGTPTPTPTPTSTAASGGGGGGGGSRKTLQLAAPSDGSLKFDKTTLDAKAGNVTIDFDNPSTTPHAVEIQGGGVDEKSETVTSSKTSLTADLKPGTYDFFCPVPGHRQAGMEGTLTVK
jgi:plastocyanin